jgi:cyclopropane-fatty-acyl-phospholipid synthase
MLRTAIAMMERGMIPDPTLRWGIRKLCTQRLRSLRKTGSPQILMDQWVNELKGSPVAISTREANTQHYEVPARFFQIVLGPHGKYSCAYWPEKTSSLGEAELNALEITVERADLKDG